MPTTTETSAVVTNLASGQNGGVVAALPGGGYVVAWSDERNVGGPTFNLETWARRYDANGNAVGSEFILAGNDNLHSYYGQMAIAGLPVNAGAGLPSGGFLVVYSEFDLSDASAFDVIGQIFTNTGTPVGGKFSISAASNNDQQLPSVAVFADGSYVVTWLDTPGGVGTGEIIAQRYNAAHQPVAQNGTTVVAAGGGNFTVNVTTTGTQQFADVTALANGDFLVVWQADTQEAGASGVYARLYNSDGTTQTVGGQSEWKINETVTDDQFNASVAALTGGGFVVAFVSDSNAPNTNDVFIRVFDANGNEVKTETIVNNTVAAGQNQPNVEALPDGGFVVTFDDGGDVRAQRFDSAGNERGTEFAVTNTAGAQNQFSNSSHDPQDTLAFTLGVNTQQVAFAWEGAGSGDTNGIFTRQIQMQSAPTSTDNTDTINEDTNYTFTISDFSFTDSPFDTPANTFAAVKFTTLATRGTLMFDADGGSIGNAVAVTLGQFISVADITAGHVFFRPVADGNTLLVNGAYATFTFQVQDNGGSALGSVDLDETPNTYSINVLPVNDAPNVIDATQSLTAINEDTANPAGQTVNAVFLASFSDADDNQVATLGSSANNFAGVAVVGNAATTQGAWQYSTGGGIWTTIGTPSDTSALLLSPTTLVRFLPAANFNGTAPTLTVRLIEDTAVAFTSGDTRNLTGLIGDPGSYSSGTIATDETIISVNDAPAGTDNTFTFLEDGTRAFTTADFGFTDPNDAAGPSGANAFASVIITSLPTAGTLTLSGNPVNAGDTISVANIPNLLYTPVANANGTPYATFTFQVKDNGGVANTGVDTDQSANTITFNITPVNDAPTATNLTQPLTINEDAAATNLFTTAPTVADIDSGSVTATLTIANAAAGVLSGGGFAATANPGEYTFTGSPAAVAAALTAVQFDSNNNFNGSTSVSVLISDGANGPQGTNPTGTISITVNSVNDAPAGTDNSFTINEDGSRAFTAADFGFTDPNDAAGPSGANALSAVIITSLPTAGTLTLSGNPVNAGDTISLANIPNLLYTPVANANGTPYATFTFQVKDNGGVVNTGVDTDQSANTITFNITPVNDAPTATNLTQPLTINEDAAATNMFTTAPTVADIDSGSVTATLTIANAAAGVLSGGGFAATANPGEYTFTGSPAAVAAALTAVQFDSNNNFNGSTSVSVLISDGANGPQGTNPTGTISITVNSVNDAPAGTDNSFTINEDGTRAFTAADFGFTDPNDAAGPSGANALSAVIITSLPTAGTLTLSGNPVNAGDTISLANIPNLLYTPVANANGTPYATFTFQVKDNGGVVNTGVDTDQSANTITFNITAVNDAPTATNLTQPLTIGEDAAATNLFTTAPTVADLDSASVTATLTIANPAAGVLVGGGFAATANPGEYTFTGDPASVAAALTAVQFDSTLDFNGSTSVSVLISDGANGPQGTNPTGTISITVNAANDAPAAVIDQATYNGTPGVDIDLKNELSVSDVDAGGANVTVTLSVTHGALTVTEGGSGVLPANIVGSGTGTVTITGTVAQIDLLLNGDATSTVKFNDPAPTGPITLTLAIDDGGATGAGGVQTAQDVATINLAEPPVIAGLGGDTATFTEGGVFVFLDNPATAATVTDADSTNFDGGSLTTTITNVVGAEDVVSIATEVGVVALSDNTNVGSEVTVNGVLIGTIAAGGTGFGGEPLTVTLNSGATPALVGILIQHLVYSNLNNVNPNLTARSINVAVNDGTGATDTETVTVNITPVNDGPTAVITPTSFNATEQTALDLKAQGLSVGDGDAGGGSVTVTLSVTEGVLNVTAGGSGAGVAGSGTSSVTLTGTIAQINALLTTDGASTVSYTDGTDNPSASATLTLAINDNGNTGGGPGLTAQDTATISITAVNDGPAATITPASYSATENITLNLKTNGLSVSDIDGNAGNMTVTLSVTEGTLNVQAGTSGAIVSGSPGASVTITGTLLQINALLNTDGTSVVQYTETDDSPSATVTLTLAINDNGNTGGGNLTAQDTATINITPANDAPTATITPASYSATENITLNLKTNGLSVSDASDGDLGSMTVTLSVTEGTLTVAAGGSGAGVAGSGTSSVTITGTVAQINALLDNDATSVVQYTETDDSPSATVTLTLAINDNGNTGGGPGLTAQDTATINITPANDAPTATITPPTYNATENITLNLKTNGLSVSDASDGNLGSMTVTLSVTEGTLNVATGTSGAVVSGSPGGSVTITGTVAQINALLNTDGTSVVQYTETDDTPSAAVTLTLAINDNGNTGGGPGLTAQDTATINITPTNDLPVVGNLTPSITYLIAAPPQTLSSGATVADPDSANLTSASVTLTDHQTGDELSVNGVLNNAVGVNGITWTYTVATGVLLLLGSSSLANYQALLDQVQYRSTSGDPSNGGTTTSRDVAWSVNDGSDPSVTQHTSINVGNQAPTVDLNGGGAGTNADQVYAENFGTQPIANATLTLADADDSNLVSATIVLTNAKPGDTLAISGALPAGITSTIDTSVAGQITVTLSGNVARSTYQTAIQQVVFSNPGENPDTTDRVITVSVNDGQDSSNNAILTVHVNSLNDAPVNTVPATQEIEANTSTAITGLSVADPDAASGSMTTTLSVQHGTLTVASVGGAAVSGSGTATVTLNGTLAAINATLAANNVVYKGALDFFGTDTLTLNTNDNGSSAVPPGGAQADTDQVTLHLNTHIIGTPNNDSYNALPGQERIDAGLGTDTITFNFRLVDASVKYVGNQVIIDGPTGSHTVLTGFEVFNFTDGTVNNNDGSPLIDDLFYYSKYHDVWNAHADADAHYNSFGWHEGRNPDAFFSTVVYLSANPDVKASGVNPLTHFDLNGWKEGRVPSITFDPAQYLAANPDVKAANIDPLRHYLANGYQEGRQPFAPSELIGQKGFDYVYYLNNNPDVANSGVDPFLHFQTVGWKEGRNPNALFDTNGYLANYLDVKAANINPLDHYNNFGWQEGRDPSVGFDTTAYLSAYADVNAAHINPLEHFLHYGIHEGRSPFADGVWG